MTQQNRCTHLFYSPLCYKMVRTISKQDLIAAHKEMKV